MNPKRLTFSWSPDALGVGDEEIEITRRDAPFGDQRIPKWESLTGTGRSECMEESGASPCDERGWLSESVDARGEGDRLLLQKVWVKRCSWSTVIPSEENDRHLRMYHEWRSSHRPYTARGGPTFCT